MEKVKIVMTGERDREWGKQFVVKIELNVGRKKEKYLSKDNVVSRTKNGDENKDEIFVMRGKWGNECMRWIHEENEKKYIIIRKWGKIKITCKKWNARMKKEIKKKLLSWKRTVK